MPASEVMGKWKHGKLHSGSKKGPVVKNQKQAIAIMLSEKRKGLQTGGVPGQPISTIAAAPSPPAPAPMAPPVAQPGVAAPPPLPQPMTSPYTPMQMQLQQGRPAVGTRSGFAPLGLGADAHVGGMAPPGWSPQIGAPGGGLNTGVGAYTGSGASTGGSPAPFPTMPAAPTGQGTMPSGQMPPISGTPPYPTPSTAMPTALPMASPNVSSFLPSGMRARGGQINRQFGGGMPWFARQEARSAMHTGPIPSMVPGRTDNHAINVPSGSYVMPAQAVSHLGQNNTNAGFAVLGRMFGKTGPYGAGTMPMGRGLRTPGIGIGVHPPRMQNVMSDRGGSRGGDAIGSAVPINAAGGEFVIHPLSVARVGGGDIKRGHAILDAWVKKIQQKHAKTIKNLPGPAKD